MKSCYKKILFIICFITSFESFSQIGVDNALPDKFSILDLKATDKGLLVPRLTTGERGILLTTCKTTTCPDGLMVFDTDKRMFYFLNNSTWFVMSPWVQSDSITGSEKMALNSVITTNVGIGTIPNSSFKLDVSGPVKISDTVSIGGSVYVKTGNLTLAAGNIKANVGNISTNSGDISTTTGKVTSKGFSSDTSAIGVAGPVPKGGIIMWSGTISQIPKGWGLCDGTSGKPDLRERFIVGAGGDNTGVTGGSYTVNTSGGNSNKDITLTVAQMPSHSHTGYTTGNGQHTHTFTDKYVDDWNKDGVFAGQSGSYMSKVEQRTTSSTTTSGTGDHTHTIPAEGGGSSFDNRPPFYALAFIIKL